ncbi:hypothetical protein FUA23_10900 [Neolewinella aurantiaca]|uniref:Uncharacterized protein n=1 Tax=Neolewinella aurantiaca TaxID=2602767 RepID=A0A5C7FHH3_9BACT|nr:hypothetical protein [Neolewinella aurantiaca]TXF89251.1 hypothetical protein FUA23_10900 [Neolewinella aurantiaca]
MKGERQLGHPYLTSSEKSTRLKRVQLNDKLISEGWLQDKLHKFPDLLPLDELDASFRESISLCREMSVASGRIDNLYLSPTGHLTLVETKLFRNPQARREVVGQIIDYAKDLSRWTFAKLDAAVRAANGTSGRPGAGILELAAREMMHIDNEAHMINAVDRGLRRGEMLLLIVGDGIHESVEDMAEYIQVAPQLRFGLGLVELQLYGMPDTEDLLIVPRVVTRTREVVRAVVHVNTSGADSAVSVSAHVPTPEVSDTALRTTISEAAFFEDLLAYTDAQQVAYAKNILALAQDAGHFIDWGSSSFVAKYPDPNGGSILISLFVVNKYGAFYLMPTEKQLQRIGVDGHLGIEYAQRIAAVIPGAQPGVDTKSTLRNYMKLSAVGSVAGEVLDVVEWLIKTIEERI